ncbi:hypothetical protein HMPREF1870_01409 [Bacteroidales bacterium KA00344]|nr:hypothetical protein HMPREF1870_01409 [Bacteroidales bacterium KA00344]
MSFEFLDIFLYSIICLIVSGCKYLWAFGVCHTFDSYSVETMSAIAVSVFVVAT